MTYLKRIAALTIPFAAAAAIASAGSASAAPTLSSCPPLTFKCTPQYQQTPVAPAPVQQPPVQNNFDGPTPEDYGTGIVNDGAWEGARKFLEVNVPKAAPWVIKGVSKAGGIFTGIVTDIIFAPKAG